MSNASQSASRITTQEWHRLQDLLPTPQIRSSYVLAALHAYNESAKSEAAQADEACDADAQAEAQKRFEAYKAGLERLMRDAQAIQTADPKAVKLVACEHAKLHRALTGYKKTVNPNNQSTRTLIFFINTLIHKQLSQLMRFNPEAFKRYATGVERVFTIKTSTSYLCKAFAADLPQEGSEDYEAAIIKKTASFRGNYGHFANLKKLGYSTEKYNLDRNNQETDCGTEVVLNINVWTWFFGGQGVSKADISALCSPSRGNSSQSSTLKEKENKNKGNNTAANAAASSAAGAAMTERKSNRLECQSPALIRSNITGKAEAPGAAAARDEKVIKVAETVWNKAFSMLFNAENLKNDKIRTNKTTPLSIITEVSSNECKRRSVALVYALIDSGLTLQDIESKAVAHIEATAKALQEGKRAYVYAPEMYLRTDFKIGTLESALRPKPKTDTAQGEAAPSETETYGEYAEWLVAQGLNKLTLRIYTQKWGSAAIEIAAQYIFLTHKHTAKVKNVGGFAQNLFRNLKSVEDITEQLDRLKRKAAPKSGQILQSIIDAMPTDTPQSVVKAWKAARAAGFKNEGKTLILKLQNKRHLDIVESDACIAAFKKAMQTLDNQYRIEYVIE